MEIHIGYRTFSSKSEAEKYYGRILHLYPTDTILPYSATLELVNLCKSNLYFYGKYIGKYGNLVDYCYISKNPLNNRTFYVKTVYGKVKSISISDFLNSAYDLAEKEFLSCPQKFSKSVEKSKGSRWHKFVKACRSAVEDSAPKQKGRQAHHANDNGFFGIVNGFIKNQKLDVNSVKLVFYHNRIRFANENIAYSFVKYHNSHVKWQMLTPEEHNRLHFHS